MNLRMREPQAMDRLAPADATTGPGRCDLRLSPLFHIRLRSSNRAVRAGLRSVQQRLEAWGLLCDCRGRVELVLAEALNNIVEHALDEVPGEEILVRLHLRASHLVVELQDSGRPPARPGPYPSCHALAAQFLQDVREPPDGGYGLFLIRSLTSDLSLSRRKGQNILRLSIPLEDGSKAPAAWLLDAAAPP